MLKPVCDCENGRERNGTFATRAKEQTRLGAGCVLAFISLDA